MDNEYEFCPNCEANLILQRGYDNSLPYWVCLSCGQMLINPDIETESDIIWRCDETNPYKGLSDDEVLDLSQYKDIDIVDGKNNIILVEDTLNHNKYVKKLLDVYDISVYEYLKDNPIFGMPKIHSIYKSRNCLIVIEDYIEGKTVAQILESSIISDEYGIAIARQVCFILQKLHNQPTPIIHRDIKPSNIIVTPEDLVYLLDINVAKWHNPDSSKDTVYMGTENFAVPEQVGYGFTSSNPKSDIYSVGVLLNVMVTGKLPKELKAEGKLGPIIEGCMRLEADNRYSTEELLIELDKVR